MGSTLTLIRSTLRSGALYFFRDPDDESFSPIKEIIETPTKPQMRKVTPRLHTLRSQQLSVSFTYHMLVISIIFGLPISLVSKQNLIPILPLEFHA